jgi:hypothetical protein
MQIISECKIIRQDFWPNKTGSEFLADDLFFAHILEDKVRPKGEYVKKQTAIDYGIFELAMTYSNRFGVVMPLLLNIQHTANPILFHGVDISNCGIRIHGGNDEDDTEGCPLMGERKDPFGNCKAINNKFRKILTASLKLHKVYLSIGKLDANGKFYIPKTW